jgi:small-conductance mechanosensitive channel
MPVAKRNDFESYEIRVFRTVRYRVFDLFRENVAEIPLTQRDAHIKSSYINKIPRKVSLVFYK